MFNKKLNINDYFLTPGIFSFIYCIIFSKDLTSKKDFKDDIMSIANVTVSKLDFNFTLNFGLEE